MINLTREPTFYRHLTGSIVLTGLLLLQSQFPANADASSDTVQSKNNLDCQKLAVKPAITAPEAPIYNPPRLGAPKTRVGGGTRNANNDSPSIELLAPASTGLTMQAMPALFWHLSDNYAGTFEFVITEHKGPKPEPLFRQQISQRLCAGFHTLNLRELKVELEKGVTYQWSVVIVRDLDRRSYDIVAHATLERTDAPDNIQRTVQHLADQGYWYDAIETIDPVNATPVNRARIQSLLQQVGLDIFETN